VEGAEIFRSQTDQLGQQLVRVLSQQWGRLPQAARCLVQVRHDSLVCDPACELVLQLDVEAARASWASYSTRSRPSRTG